MDEATTPAHDALDPDAPRLPPGALRVLGPVPDPATPAARRRSRQLASFALLTVLTVVAGLALRLLEPDPSLLEDAGMDVLVVYEVSERGLADADVRLPDRREALDRVSHDRAWQRWLAVAPPIWAHRIDRFALATDGAGGNLGAVSATGTSRTLVIDPADADDAEKLTYVLVHELAHLVVLQDGEPSRLEADELPVSPLGPRCDGRELVEACVTDGTLLAGFAAAFWTDEAIAAARAARAQPDPRTAVVELWAEDRRRYVTPYAASSPDEDLAETFVALVLGDDQPAGTVAAAKVEHLRRQQVFAALAVDLRHLR